MSDPTIYILQQFVVWLGLVTALVLIVAFLVFVALYILGTVLQALDKRKNS